MARMLEDRMTTLTQTGLVIAGIILGVAVGYGLVVIVRNEDEQERTSQQRCLERGGKITMYAGGFTKWACEGMTKF